MKARDLLIQLTTLCAQNPQVLEQEVEIVFTDGSAMNPVSVELVYQDIDAEEAGEPDNIGINVL